MRALHLFSNSKWTGPAEPALNLCVQLRALGLETAFACAAGPSRNLNKVAETARDLGVDPILHLGLHKHRHPLRDVSARRALARHLDNHPVDIIHCHLDNDHEVTLGPAAKRGIPIVRSSYHGIGFPAGRRHARLLHGAAMTIEPSRIALEHDARVHGVAAEKLRVVPNAVDVHRFDPARETPDGRRWLNLPRDAFVLGIVARMQTHRHFEDLFQALRKLLEECPNVHVIVVGRGTKQEQVALQPVRDAGLESHVHFSGYIEGENYVGMLRGFDAGIFLVPGSDGTCRAAREIMAMGKPLVVADRGMLREIVTHEEDGLVCDGSVEGLCDAVVRLAKDRAGRVGLGQAARAKAASRYSLEHQAREVLAVYEAVLA